MDEVVLEVKLHHSFLAKSHTPSKLLRQTGMTIRGTMPWEQPAGLDDDEPVVELARGLFVSTRDDGVAALRDIVAFGSSEQKVEADVCKVESIRVSRPPPYQPLREGGPAETTAVEIVLYNWDVIHRQAAIARIEDLLASDSVPKDQTRVKIYPGGPAFIAARVPQKTIAKLSELNFVRQASALPRVAPTRVSLGGPHPAPALPPRKMKPLHHIAVFDGGAAKPHAYLDDFVEHFDLTTEPPDPDLISHGTAVCSAALYGSLRPNTPQRDPLCGVFSFRVLPDPQDDFNLYGLIDTLEDEVPKLPSDVRVVNLSLGPAGPIDTSPSRFTYAIDRLAHETGRIFFVAVGNWGDVAGADRIQAPSDSVNNISVGAFKRDPQTGAIARADYSCRGPGREGCMTKPDMLCFGGSSESPFLVHDSNPGFMVGTQGTSFAAPVAAATAGRLFARLGSNLTTQGCRALLLHSLRPNSSIPERDQGWGCLTDEGEESLLECSPTNISVLYEGSISPRNSWKLPFLLPKSFSHSGRVNFRWTIVHAPDVDVSSAADYTLAGIEWQFRPHSRRYKFTSPDESQTETLDILDESARCDELRSLGWKCSQAPVTDGGKPLREQALRKDRSKWDTILRAAKGKNNPVHDPCLTITIVGRGDWDDRTDAFGAVLSAPFAAVLTVSVPKYGGDLYAEVLQEYNELRPLVVKPMNDIMVSLST